MIIIITMIINTYTFISLPPRSERSEQVAVIVYNNYIKWFSVTIYKPLLTTHNPPRAVSVANKRLLSYT